MKSTQQEEFGMAMLEVKDLHVHYGVIEAIKGISFEVEQGEVIDRKSVV